MASKNFVLDTNVLIENPRCIAALRNGEENRIHVPWTVLAELDGLQRDPRIGHVVGQAINALVGDETVTFLPPLADDVAPTPGNIGDDRILGEIASSALESPILITNDRILQLKARVRGIPVEGYRDSVSFQSESQRYTGFVMDGEDPVPNCFRWENGQPVFHGTDGPRAVTWQHEVWKVAPRSVHQNLAFELMLHPGIDIVSIQSEAGYGKTFLALAAALHLVFERKDTPYRKIYLVKPVVEIGARMGFLPGDIEEKMHPYIRYVQDLLLKLHDLRPANRVFQSVEAGNMKLNPKRFEIQPIAYVRGMNLENAVVIIDEMQNLSRNEARALLTRMGEGVKCFCLGDTRQVDNQYLNESNNGLNWVVKKLKGFRNYAHIVLKGERSRGPITDIVLRSRL